MIFSQHKFLKAYVGTDEILVNCHTWSNKQWSRRGNENSVENMVISSAWSDRENVPCLLNKCMRCEASEEKDKAQGFECEHW